MLYRKHGGLELSEVGVGCYALSGAYGPKDAEAYQTVLRRAYELGVNFFDTAEAYGDAERILGETVKPFRDKVYLATKVGAKAGLKPNLSRAYVKQACEESLLRLGTDRIDLYQVHFDDPDTPVAETIGALEELAREGKIRRYGVGHLPAPRVAAYFASGHVFSMLMELSAAAREARRDLLPLCRAHGAGAIAFSVTGRGLLTGGYGEGHQFPAGDIRSIDPLFQRERCQSGLRVARKLDEMGRRYGKSAVQAGIAWVLTQPGIVCALIGPSTVEHLVEDLGGSGWEFPPEDLAGFEEFLRQEDAWLAREQALSVGRILGDPLPNEFSRAFKDLVYAIETAIQLGLVAEDEVLPIFRELFALQKQTDETARPELECIRGRLGRLIRTESRPWASSNRIDSFSI